MLEERFEKLSQDPQLTLKDFVIQGLGSVFKGIVSKESLVVESLGEQRLRFINPNEKEVNRPGSICFDAFGNEIILAYPYLEIDQGELEHIDLRHVIPMGQLAMGNAKDLFNLPVKTVKERFPEFYNEFIDALIKLVTFDQVVQLNPLKLLDLQKDQVMKEGLFEIGGKYIFSLNPERVYAYLEEYTNDEIRDGEEILLFEDCYNEIKLLKNIGDALAKENKDIKFIVHTDDSNSCLRLTTVLNDKVHLSDTGFTSVIDILTCIYNTYRRHIESGTELLDIVLSTVNKMLAFNSWGVGDYEAKRVWYRDYDNGGYSNIKLGGSIELYSPTSPSDKPLETFKAVDDNGDLFTISLFEKSYLPLLHGLNFAYVTELIRKLTSKSSDYSYSGYQEFVSRKLINKLNEVSKSIETITFDYDINNVEYYTSSGNWNSYRESIPEVRGLTDHWVYTFNLGNRSYNFIISLGYRYFAFSPFYTITDLNTHIPDYRSCPVEVGNLEDLATYITNYVKIVSTPNRSIRTTYQLNEKGELDCSNANNFSWHHPYRSVENEHLKPSVTAVFKDLNVYLNITPEYRYNDVGRLLLGRGFAENTLNIKVEVVKHPTTGGINTLPSTFAFPFKGVVEDVRQLALLEELKTILSNILANLPTIDPKDELASERFHKALLTSVANVVF